MSYIKDFLFALLCVYLINNGLPLRFKEFIFNNINDLLNFDYFYFNGNFIRVKDGFLVYYGDNELTENDTDDEEKKGEEKNDENNNITKTQQSEIKFEDKYIECIKKLDKYWQFNDEENSKIEVLKINFFISYKNDYIEHINDNSKRIETIKKKLEIDDSEFIKIHLSDNNGDNNGDINCYCSNVDQSLDDDFVKNEKEYLTEQLIELLKETEFLENLIQSEQGLSELNDKSAELAKQTVINDKLEKLKDCYVMEKTPLGNVLLRYNHNLEHFEYYSDNTIPYRYLETVGRKFVKCFNCRPIFVDMEEELNLYKKKLEEERKKEELNKSLLNTGNNSSDQKKNVFTKFKSYNNNTAKIMSVAPSKTNASMSNSISMNNKNVTKTDDKILLKERSNRYSNEGKFANFNFIQKVDKKKVNKKLNLSFADYKRLTLNSEK